MKNLLSFCAVLFFATAAEAAPVKQWNVVADQSKIEFSVLQNTSQISGEFKSFAAEISFDQANLAKSSAKVEIDLNSLTMSYADALPTAKGKDWFDVKAFPKAIFVSKKI
jgi:polyisoprenoid-binding protein YceI